MNDLLVTLSVKFQFLKGIKGKGNGEDRVIHLELEFWEFSSNFAKVPG